MLKSNRPLLEMTRCDIIILWSQGYKMIHAITYGTNAPLSHIHPQTLLALQSTRASLKFKLYKLNYSTFVYLNERYKAGGRRSRTPTALLLSLHRHHRHQVGGGGRGDSYVWSSSSTHGRHRRIGIQYSFQQASVYVRHVNKS